MTYKIIKFNAEQEEPLNKFLNLPTRIYSKKEIIQNRREEIELLKGTHILSKYFKVCPFIAVDESNMISARCIVTLYPEKKCAYIGFFECINDDSAAHEILSEAEKYSVEMGYKSIVGPVDCSFWIRYRLKVNMFGTPYSGEPYNKSYYESFFEKNGYNVCGEYISNRFRKVKKTYHNEKFEERLTKMITNGYEFISPKSATFDKTLREIYSLLIELYSDFQTYSRITETEFVSLYSPLKKIVNYSMIKCAYYQGKPVGFFVSVPNFGNNASGKITLKKLVKIMNKKINCDDYVMLYMGVDPKHRGLGKALAETICCELTNNQATSTGALIRRGKINGGYFNELVDFEYQYRLYEKSL